MDRSASVAVDGRAVEDEQPAVDEVPVAPAAAGRQGTVRAEDPVGAVGPRVVEEAGQREQVGISLRLPAAVLVEHHVPQIDVLAVAGEDVRQRAGHGVGSELLGLLARLGVGAVDGRAGQDFAGLGLNPAEVDPPVQIGRSARRAIGRAVLDQQASEHGRRGLELAAGRDVALVARGPQAPGQGAVGGPHAVNAPVAAPEDRPAPVHRRRRIDAGAGREVPRWLAGIGVHGPDPVLVHGGDEDLAFGHRGAAELAADGRLPPAAQGGRHRGRRAAASGGIVTVGGPVGGGMRDEG